jgi:hypothetical protein
MYRKFKRAFRYQYVRRKLSNFTLTGLRPLGIITMPDKPRGFHN